MFQEPGKSGVKALTSETELLPVLWGSQGEMLLTTLVLL